MPKFGTREVKHLPQPEISEPTKFLFEPPPEPTEEIPQDTEHPKAEESPPKPSTKSPSKSFGYIPPGSPVLLPTGGAKFSDQEFRQEMLRYRERVNLEFLNRFPEVQTSRVKFSQESSTAPIGPRGAVEDDNGKESGLPAVSETFWEGFERREEKIWECYCGRQMLPLRREIQSTIDFVKGF